MPEIRACFRTVLGLLAALSLAFGAAHAQTFPTKPVKIMVGYAPGGPSDIISRVVGAKMGEILGQQFIIENRTGAGGTLATEAVG